LKSKREEEIPFRWRELFPPELSTLSIFSLERERGRLLSCCVRIFAVKFQETLHKDNEERKQQRESEGKPAEGGNYSTHPTLYHRHPKPPPANGKTPQQHPLSSC